MSLDELPDIVAHRRDREFYDYSDTARDEEAVREAISVHEETGGAWVDTFTQWKNEARQDVHWPERPGIDAAIFAVDGDVPEQARRDTQPQEIPS